MCFVHTAPDGRRRPTFGNGIDNGDGFKGGGGGGAGGGGRGGDRYVTLIVFFFALLSAFRLNALCSRDE